MVLDAEHFERSIGLLGDQIDGLREEIRALSQSQASSMAEAMRSVLTDPQTLGRSMDIVVSTAQKRAAEKTGNAVGAAIKSLLTRWVVIGCVVLIVAKTAGIDIAGKVWATIIKVSN